MRLICYLVLINLFFTWQAFAKDIDSSCPWKSGSELFTIDLDHNVKKVLSQTEVVEDLLCLKMLFQNYYIAQKFYPEINLINRLEEEILGAQPMSNEKLLEDIFALHAGIYDIHLRYRLPGNLKMFKPKSTTEVSMVQKLEEDKIHEFSKFIYFKPAPLLGELSVGQNTFVEYVKSHDSNIVLDLRQLGGGDDVFAHALTKALFTPSQHVPTVTKLQVESPLKDVGLANLIKILKYRGGEEYYQAIKDRYQNSPIVDLLPYTIEKEVEFIKGERPHPYKSKLALLIDSGCKSSCETIVEKLSGHPNVRFFGANTGGALLYSNGMTFELPHSRILVSIPTLAHLYEASAPEGEGYSPDVYMDSIDLNQLEF